MREFLQMNKSKNLSDVSEDEDDKVRDSEFMFLFLIVMLIFI